MASSPEKRKRDSKKAGEYWDIRKCILITPETDLEQLNVLAEAKGFILDNPLRKNAGLFTLDAFRVPDEHIQKRIDGINA